MSRLHDRQPVILDPAYKEWLDPAMLSARVKELLKQNLDDQLEFQPVSRDMNSAKFSGKPLAEVNPL